MDESDNKCCFTVGDIVVLRSGGPVMTVDATWIDGACAWGVECVWIESGGAPHRDQYRPESLVYAHG